MEEIPNEQRTFESGLGKSLSYILQEQHKEIEQLKECVKALERTNK